MSWLEAEAVRQVVEDMEKYFGLDTGYYNDSTVRVSVYLNRLRLRVGIQERLYQADFYRRESAESVMNRNVN